MRRRAPHAVHNPAYAVVRLAGEITSENADRVADELRNALRPAVRTLEIDLQRVTFLDSNGARAFLPVLRPAQQHGIRLVVTHTSSEARSAFDRLGVTHLLDIHEGAMPDVG
ncbi:STAS domain-containing protein [Streptomyces sp. MUSC 14]|uniref:STAS domain-containing protein n=1 Tax=Streptomyces sp. MUSC 14 TaxID=1354889 RepID=UPI0015A5A2E7|nr:STAS domain-containing protein [Streptomyces sp. MUSC 14]